MRGRGGVRYREIAGFARDNQATAAPGGPNRLYTERGADSRRPHRFAPGLRKGAAAHRGRSPASTESGAASATTGAGATSSATRRSAITSLLASVAASSNADSSATGSSPTTRASATRRVGTTSTVHITGASASEKTKVRARKTPTTVAPTTPRTVMGGGNAATWPAARPFPPSLAGAYSTNLKTAFIALVNYSDWVGSHPNPNLVKNLRCHKLQHLHPLGAPDETNAQSEVGTIA